MGKKTDPPPAPDYTQAAERTAQSNQYAQTFADWANRPQQYTPWGSSTWSSSPMIDPATGQQVTQWSQNIQLSPQQQQALNSQMAIQQGRSDLASGMMGRMWDEYSTPYDWSNLQAYGQVPTADDAGRQRIEESLMAKMEPEHQKSQAALEAKLGQMGLTRGTAAWNKESQRLRDLQSRDRFQAVEQAGQEQQRQFGMQMQGAGYANQLRAAQIAEQMQRRGMTLNEINAILSGQQVNMPGMPSFNTSQSAGGVNYSGAAQNQYNAGMDAYNAQQQQQQSMMSGIGQVAGMAGMMMMSDIRLKSNIVRIGTHPIGVGIYEYDIFDRRERGVIAQELQQVAPHLVHQHPSGYLMVDYGGLQ